MHEHHHTLLFKLAKLQAILSNARYRSAFLGHGVAAAVEHSSVAWPCAYRSVIDVGAHHGQFALAALELFPDATILCIEPSPNAYARLQTVLERYQGRVATFLQGVGSKFEEKGLYIHTHDATSSLLIPHGDHVQRSGSHPTGERVKVHITPLDQMFEDLARPALLKIDVQGYELEALKGAETLLAEIDTVYVEACWHPCYMGQPEAWEVIDWLRERDWVLKGVQGNPIEGNLLFERIKAQESSALRKAPSAEANQSEGQAPDQNQPAA